MITDFAPRMAQVLTDYSAAIKPGDYVAIVAPTLAEPWIMAMYEAVLRRGGNPFVRLLMPGLQETYFRLASDEQLDFCDPLMVEFFNKIDVMFQVMAPANTKELSKIDPSRLARSQQANRPILERYFARDAEGSLRWNLCAWPTHAAAQEAEMGLHAYSEFVYRACGLDQDDPVAYWQEFSERQALLVDWLKDKRHAEIHGPGIDLSFDFGGRLWINCDGKKNFPDGEIFTGPIEDSVNGTVSFSYPTVYGGREINGVKLTFEQGRVVDASAAKGQDYLFSQLDMDEGARRLGEFAIGTNNGVQQFTGNTLFDEKIGGTIHMALGKSIEESGGVNQSAIHWDMVHGMQDGGEIIIDGELFYRAGEFTVK
jgi:aminopeptidase